MEAERLAHEAQREEHRLVDLLHARAREALLVPLPRGGLRAGARRRAEEAVAPRVVAQARDLGVEPRARRAADARDLRAEEGEVLRGEDEHEAEVREAAEGRRLAVAEDARRRLQPGREGEDGERRGRPRERADQPDGDVDGGERCARRATRRAARRSPTAATTSSAPSSRSPRNVPSMAFARFRPRTARIAPSDRRGRDGVRQRQRALGVEDDEAAEGERARERRRRPRGAARPQHEEHERGHARKAGVPEGCFRGPILGAIGCAEVG